MIVQPNLTTELRSLCGRLATERLRAEGWRIASELRLQMLARLRAGEDAQALADELQRAIQAAAEASKAR